MVKVKLNYCTVQNDYSSYLITNIPEVTVVRFLVGVS